MGKGRIGVAAFSGVLEVGGISTNKLGFVRSESKISEDGLRCLGAKSCQMGNCSIEIGH